MWCSDVRKFMWQTLEDPNHSKCSKGVAAVFVLVILTSIVAMCIHSMPEFRYAPDSEHSVLDSLELICIIFFSVEFVLRVIAAPQPWRFLGNPLNMIDMASILHFYVTLAFESVDEEDWGGKPTSGQCGEGGSGSLVNEGLQGPKACSTFRRSKSFWRESKELPKREKP
ncbi:hypothetical protein cypCar_00021292 [Cyprinus carpio]|nr:hypothetical protein cypCar_00021292 [Cyprinus carpio]